MTKDEALTQLRKVHATQGRDGCWDIDDYMLGLYNGLELALSIMENRECRYKQRPKSQPEQETIMGKLKLPELWYAKTHMPTQQIFKDCFCDNMCLGWSTTPIRDLHTVAIKRIAELNTKMPNEWQYVILGWELNKEKNT